VIRAIFNWLTSNVLDRVLSTVDKRIEAKTDREAIKGQIIKSHYATRADYMKAGGFWLMAAFAAPLALWHGAVVVYSIFWCADCAFPQDWTIAALPAPLDEWAGFMIVSIFGVIGVSRFSR